MATFVTRRRGLLALFALPSLLALTLAQVSAEPKPADKIQVRVVAVLATKDGEVDPRLKCFSEEVRKTLPQLHGFEIGKTSCRLVAVGTPEHFDLGDGQHAVVTLLQIGDKDTPTQLKVAAANMGEVTYETTCGQFLPIITKYRTTKTNAVLMVAVCVRPCAKGK